MPFYLMQTLRNASPGRLAGGATGAPRACRKAVGAPAPRRKAEPRPEFKKALVIILVALVTLGPTFAAHAVTPAQGDKIVNSVSLQSGNASPASSQVTVTTVIRTPSAVEFLKYAAPLAGGTPVPGSSPVSIATTSYRTGSDPAASFVTIAPPKPLGSDTAIDLSIPVPLVAATAYHAGEPVFVRVTDHDQNLDRSLRETVITTITNSDTNEIEVLRLTETGPDTGVFVGYIDSIDATTASGASSYNGYLPVKQGSPLKGNYVDVVDGSDSSAATVVVDPLGIVFDSKTGAPIDGASVTLWDVTANRGATVFGDDGVSIFPATVTTGSVPKDSSGRSYAYPPGGFRFPFITPGTYQLRVSAPANSGYVIPSAASNASLAQLPGGGFTVVTGSRGETFLVDPGPALRIDIPADPTSAGLWVQKSAGKSQVAAGDFLPYLVTVQNRDTTHEATQVTMTDRLPLGFRYRKGSTRINSLAAGDPTISADGRTLFFTLGNLASSAGATIAYVTEVAAGAQMGVAVNAASAQSGGIPSNTATASVEVRSDFLSSRGIIAGRVYRGSCAEEDQGEDRGIAGIRIYLEDGTFVDTDQKGMYHFEGVRPASHVVQLDLDSLPPGYSSIACEKNSRFAGRSFSQFVDLQGGTLWRADFHVAKSQLVAPAGAHDPVAEAKAYALANPPAAAVEPVPETSSVNLDLKSALKGQAVAYQVRMWGEPAQLSNLKLTVTLPDGVVYLPNSSELDGHTSPEPDQNGNELSYPIPSPTGEWIKVLRFRAGIDRSGASGELQTKAVLHFDTAESADQPTPEAENTLQLFRDESRVILPEIVMHPHFPTFGAELNAEDREALDDLARVLMVLNISQIKVAGHTDTVRIAPRSRHLYQDNKALSRARAKSVGRYLIEKLHLPPSKLDFSGFGEGKPVASNKSDAGRALNRRVEIRVQATREIDRSRFALKRDESGVKKVEVAYAAPAPLVQPKGEQADPPVLEQRGSAAEDRVKEKEGILSPAAGTILAQRINAVRICLATALKPHLILDGVEIAPERIGFTLSDPGTGKSLYTYIGVDFGAKGEHLLQLRGADGFGISRVDAKLTVVRSGEIKTIRLLSSAGNIADGKTPVKVRLQLLDATGNVVPGEIDLDLRKGTLSPLKSAGAPAATAPAQGEKVHVDSDGLVSFQPVTASGSYRAELSYNNGSPVEVETYVRPVMRDWILVGLGEGNLGYNTVSGHMENLQGAGVDEKLYENGRLAFYAKGTVKGSWLLTASYDSAKSKAEVGNKLFQAIDPNTYYTLYADASSQQYDASSAKKLYLKIERDQFYALFGDFDTGLTVTELSRYSRRLTGVKTELQGKNVELNAFGSETGQSFAKDELRGDGTSGLYHLSKANIVANTEKVTIEVRDRFHSQTVISAQAMTRFTDYSIDYDSGTIFFKEPVYNRDPLFNPIYIVVDYETADGGKNSLTYGGRVGVKLLDQKVKAGFSYLHEGQVSGKGESYGADTTIVLAEGTVLKAEVARTENSFPGSTVATGSPLAAPAVTPSSGNAYLAELSRRSGSLDSRAYFRETDPGFGLGQQPGSEAGTRKAGVDAAYRLTEKFSLSGQANRDYNLSTGAQRDVVEAKALYAGSGYGANIGVRHANDLLGDGSSKKSDQLTMGANWLTLNKKLSLKVDHDQSIGGSGNADYPTRTTLGADYKVTDHVSLFGQQELTSGSTSTSATRGGVKTTPWTGAAANSSLERDSSDNENRLFALFGLKQTVKLNEKWSIDGGMERSQTIKRASYQFNTNVPPASGNSEDFTAVSLGNGYQEKAWSWNTRGEYRSSTSEDKWSFLTAFTGEPAEGWGWSARLQYYDSQTVPLVKKNIDLRLGLVYRPLKTRWILLDRLDLLLDNQKAPATPGVDGKRVVNNLSANCRPRRDTQISLQYGAKYVLENIDYSDYSGYTDLIGVEGRYDLTKEWDIGVRGSLLHSWGPGQLSYSSGLSLGYNVVQNAWISLGYNLIGFNDRDFSVSDYTAKGPYFRFRFKFDQNSVKDAVKWVNQ